MSLRVATTRRARVRGLAFSRSAPPCALLIPRCSSVHTFGMRFALDVYFLDADGDLLRAALGVPPRRLLVCRGACSVLELPAGTLPAPPGR